ncbi:hypothetical protein [Culturomica massiliensis]|uniref:hypothetical protein n=1 Tax=Culturomica massiliensis TaxID=1841857 RepID=UPI0008399BD7|nr:hypothetical protein [Culturomica massiliensis]
MKTFIAIIASFVSGILIGYYYREASVEEEIREKLYEQERQESERRKQENGRAKATLFYSEWLFLYQFRAEPGLS